MKHVLIALFLIVSMSLMAQNSNSKQHYGVAFPLGSKLTLKLTPTDSVYFNLEVVEYSRYDTVVDMLKKDAVLSSKGDENTISICFCNATHGKDEKERKDNMNILLLAKNHTKYRIDYISEIQTVKDGKFKSTSNIGLQPGLKTMEIWPFMITSIGLRNFKIHKE